MGDVHLIYGARPAEAGVDNVPYLHGRSRPVNPLVERLELQSDHVVLQFGAGNGDLAMDVGRKLERLGGKGILFAEEFSPRLIGLLDERVAQARLDHRVRVVPMSTLRAEVFSLTDNSVDRFVSVNVMQYLDLQSGYWQELRRVLKPGAMALITDWKSGALRSYNSYRDDLYWAKTKICLQGLGFKTQSESGIAGMDWVIQAQ